MPATLASVWKDYKHLDMSYLHIWHPKHLHWHPMYLPLKLELLQLIQFFLLLSPVMRLMNGNVIHGLKHRNRPSPQSLLYIKWWTSSRDKLTWLWFCLVDACSMIALFVMWNKLRFHFSKFFEMWVSNCQMPKCGINTGSWRYGTMKTTTVTWRVWTWRRLSTADN